MTSGGARNRSGPAPSPTSLRSDKRGLRFAMLPASGHDGAIPDFPLPDRTPREQEVWEELWRTPQATVWSLASHRWRHRIIGLYVRQSVKCEAHEVGAAHLAQLHRFADQIGLTDAGLAAMGYRITDPGVEQPAPVRGLSSRDRLPRVGALERARQRAEGA